MTEAAESNVQTQEAQAPQTETNSFSVPEEYADRGWAKTIKSQEDLYKAFDNSQSLLGKRPAGIPEKDAPQEEWDKFYTTLGRPETPDGYELTDSFEGLPEDLDISSGRAKAAELAHKIGLSPEKANELWEGYMAMELEALQGQEAQKAELEANLDKEFDDLGNKMFGDQFEHAMKKAQEHLKDILPEELGDITKDLADRPKALIALIKMANTSQEQVAKVKQEYGAEDSLKSGEQSAAVSIHEINAKLADAKSRYTKAPVFSPERQVIQDEIDSLRSQLKKSI